MSHPEYIPLILLVFAFVFAFIETFRGFWKEPRGRPHLGWASIAILILVEIFYHGQGVFK